MKSKYKLFGIFVFIFLILFINLVFAQGEINGEGKIKTYLGKAKDFYNDKVKENLISLGDWISQTSKEQLGFTVPAGRIGKDFLIGLFVGLLLWIIHYIWEVTRYAIRGKVRLIDSVRIYGKEQTPVERMHLDDDRTRWHDFIARDIWKVPVMGVAFAVIMQIPILNIVVGWITLEFWLQEGWENLGRVILITLELWYIPAFIEKYNRHKVATMYDKAITRAKKSQAAYEAEN